MRDGDDASDKGGAILGGLIIVAAGVVILAGCNGLDLKGKDTVTPNTVDLDPTFGQSGYIVHNNAAGGNSRDRGDAVVVDISGRILVTGFSAGSGRTEMTIWRFNTDGVLDTTFNGKGFVTHSGRADMYYVYGTDIAIDSSSRIVIVGFDGAQLALWRDICVWRYLEDGSPDSTFNGVGYLMHNPDPELNGRETGNAVIIDASGNILVAGNNEYYRYQDAKMFDDMTVWRFTAEGTPDSTFNNKGYVTHRRIAGAGGNAWGHGE